MFPSDIILSQSRRIVNTKIEKKLKKVLNQMQADNIIGGYEILIFEYGKNYIQICIF